MCGCGCGSALANCQLVNYAQVQAALFLIAPQFYTTDPTKLEGYQSLYELLLCQVNQCLLTCNTAMIFAFLMAHYLTIASQPNGPNVGVYYDMKEGELSLGFNVDAGMSALNTTIYGRSYIDLVKRTVIGTTVSNLPPVFGGIQVAIPGLGCCGGYGGYGGYGYAGW